jgi:hypothetical protein
MNTPRLPTLWKIIDTDYIALLAVFTPATLWVLYLFFKIFRLVFRDELFYMWLSVGATALGVALLTWRFISIRQLFENGLEAKGKILKVFFYRDRGRVDYEYRHQGAKYQGANNFHRTPSTRNLTKGDAVTVVVDPANPKRSMIKDVYF